MKKNYVVFFVLMFIFVVPLFSCENADVASKNQQTKNTSQEGDVCEDGECNIVNDGLASCDDIGCILTIPDEDSDFEGHGICDGGECIVCPSGSCEIAVMLLE